MQTFLSGVCSGDPAHIFVGSPHSYACNTDVFRWPVFAGDGELKPNRTAQQRL